MSATSKVAVILGAGPNVGHGVARTFASKGYKVALAARSVDEADNTETRLHIKADFSKSDDVVNVFKKVNEVFGIPSVVVYNVSAAMLTPPDDPFALTLEALDRHLAINVTSAFVAAQHAVSGFAQLPESASRTFIYTGNFLNTTILPRFMDQGIGKSGAAHMIRAAAAAYKDRGYKFYYADERKSDGTAAYDKVDGDEHGKIYHELSEGKTQGPWLQTFVKGAGYQKFHDF